MIDRKESPGEGHREHGLEPLFKSVSLVKKGERESELGKDFVRPTGGSTGRMWGGGTMLGRLLHKNKKMHKGGARRKGPGVRTRVH